MERLNRLRKGMSRDDAEGVRRTPGEMSRWEEQIRLGADLRERYMRQPTEAVHRQTVYADCMFCSITNASGIVTAEYFLREGEYDGPYITRWDEGGVKEQGFFQNGRKVGRFRRYAPDGSLWQEDDFGPVELT